MIANQLVYIVVREVAQVVAQVLAITPALVVAKGQAGVLGPITVIVDVMVVHSYVTMVVPLVAPAASS